MVIILLKLKLTSVSCCEGSLIFSFTFSLKVRRSLADAAPRAKHVPEVEGVRRAGRVLQLEAERDEPHARQRAGREAGGEAVASGALSKETKTKVMLLLLYCTQNVLNRTQPIYD